MVIILIWCCYLIVCRYSGGQGIRVWRMKTPKADSHWLTAHIFIFKKSNWLIFNNLRTGGVILKPDGAVSRAGSHCVRYFTNVSFIRAAKIQQFLIRQNIFLNFFCPGTRRLFDSLRSLTRTAPLGEIKILSEIVRLPAVARKNDSTWEIKIFSGLRLRRNPLNISYL